MGLEKSSSAVPIYFSPSDNEENTARCTGTIRKNHLRQRKSGYESMCFSLFPLRSFSLFLRATFFCSIWTIQSDSSNWLIMTWRKAIVRLIQSNATCGRQRGLSADVLKMYLNIMPLHHIIMPEAASKELRWLKKGMKFSKTKQRLLFHECSKIDFYAEIFRSANYRS